MNKPINQQNCPQGTIDNIASRRRITSQQLFAKQNEIVIEHQGEEYRLRITSNGKLILTK